MNAQYGPCDAGAAGQDLCNRLARLRAAAQTLFAFDPAASGSVGASAPAGAEVTIETGFTSAGGAPPSDADARLFAQAQSQADEAAAVMRALAEVFRQSDDVQVQTGHHPFRAQDAHRAPDHDRANQTARTERAMALGEFASLVAHEINQPIAAILLNCGVARKHLAHRDADLARVAESLARIERDVERAAATLQRIRAMVANCAPEFQSLSLNHLVMEALGFVENELTAAGVDVVAEFYPDLPRVLGDRVQIHQVLVNLYLNAVDAMRASPVGPRVLTVSTGMEGHPFVTVRDTGPGISTETHKRLFDPMFTTKPGGIGLGLSISRSIVETHGGRLWAAHDPCGQAVGGACFCFTLRPACVGSDAESASEVAKVLPPTIIPVGEGLTKKVRKSRFRRALRA